MSARNADPALARSLAPRYQRAEHGGRVLLRDGSRESGSLENADDYLKARLS